MINEEQLIKEITDDFYETFKDEPMETGWLGAMLCGEPMLPQGVNPEDPRIKELITKARKARNKEA